MIADIYMVRGKYGGVYMDNDPLNFCISHMKRYSDRYGIPYKFFEKSDVHVNFAGSPINVRKEVSDHTIAIALCIISSIHGKSINKKYAVVGKMNLNGNILPVSNIHSRVLAATRHKDIEQVFIPCNSNDKFGIKELEKKGIMSINLLAKVNRRIYSKAIIGVFGRLTHHYNIRKIRINSLKIWCGESMFFDELGKLNVEKINLKYRKNIKMYLEEERNNIKLRENDTDYSVDYITEFNKYKASLIAMKDWNNMLPK